MGEQGEMAQASELSEWLRLRIEELETHRRNDPPARFFLYLLECRDGLSYIEPDEGCMDYYSYLEQQYQEDYDAVSAKLEEWLRDAITFMYRLPSDNELTFTEDEMRNRVRAAEIMDRLLISCHDIQGFLPSPAEIAIGFGNAAMLADKTTPDVQNTFDTLCFASHSVTPYNLTAAARKTRRKQEFGNALIRYIVTGATVSIIYIMFLKVLQFKGFIPAAITAAVAILVWLIIGAKTGPKNSGPQKAPPIDTPVNLDPEAQQRQTAVDVLEDLPSPNAMSEYSPQQKAMNILEDRPTAREMDDPETRVPPPDYDVPTETMKQLASSPLFCPQCCLQLEVTTAKGMKRAYCTRCDKSYALADIKPNPATLVKYKCPRCEAEMLLPERALHQLITCPACGRQSTPRHDFMRILITAFIIATIVMTIAWFFSRIC